MIQFQVRGSKVKVTAAKKRMQLKKQVRNCWDIIGICVTLKVIWRFCYLTLTFDLEVYFHIFFQFKL